MSLQQARRQRSHLTQPHTHPARKKTIAVFIAAPPLCEVAASMALLAPSSTAVSWLNTLDCPRARDSDFDAAFRIGRKMAHLRARSATAVGIETATATCFSTMPTKMRAGATNASAGATAVQALETASLHSPRTVTATDRCSDDFNKSVSLSAASATPSTFSFRLSVLSRYPWTFSSSDSLALSPSPSP